MKKLSKIIALIIVLIFIDALAATNVAYYATVVDKFENGQSSEEVPSAAQRTTTATAFTPVPGSYSLCVKLPNGNIKTLPCSGGTYNSTAIGHHVAMTTKAGLFSGYDWVTKIAE
jgi:hypothetical protein